MNSDFKDIQARNILLRIQDPDVLRDMEESELVYPSARKITSETAVFASRRAPGPYDRWLGRKSATVLCDFGEARPGKSSHTGLIQPAPFRAPEVLLEIPWSEPIDIWNLGCMVRSYASLLQYNDTYWHLPLYPVGMASYVWNSTLPSSSTG